MVLVIDTSSARSALAVLSSDLEPQREVVRDSGREFDVAREAAGLVDLDTLTAVAIARGPGSFTGLRIGAAYAVGLAAGLGLPLRPFGSLELQQARARGAATAVIEAGRGRVYYLTPAGERGLAEPAELPRGAPAVGWLRPGTGAGLRDAGVTFLDDSGLFEFAAAAATVIANSPETRPDSLQLVYMQSFLTLR